MIMPLSAKLEAMFALMVRRAETGEDKRLVCDLREQVELELVKAKGRRVAPD